MAATSKLYISQSLELLTPPKTPPVGSESKLVHPWPEPETEREEIDLDIPWNSTSENRKKDAEEFHTPHQDVLLLHGPKQRYAHTKRHPIPRPENDQEMLIAVEVIGLNPIDWKAPYVSLRREVRDIVNECSETSDLACQIYLV